MPESVQGLRHRYALNLRTRHTPMHKRTNSADLYSRLQVTSRNTWVSDWHKCLSYSFN